MLKKSLGVFVFALLILSVVMGAVVVSAADTLGTKVLEIWSVWEKGDVDKDTLKIFVLLLVGFMVFAALGSAQFPENGFLRFLLSAIVAFLATTFITSEEVIGIFSSYTALGVAISYFIPVAILVFLTIAMAKKGGVPGIVFSKILWLIFSTYAIVKGALVFLVKAYANNGVKFPLADSVTLTKDSFVDGWFKSWVASSVSPELLTQAAFPLGLTGFIMLIMGFGALYFGVINTGLWTRWLSQRLDEEKVEVFGSKIKKSSAFVDKTSEAVDKASG